MGIGCGQHAPPSNSDARHGLRQSTKSLVKTGQDIRVSLFPGEDQLLKTEIARGFDRRNKGVSINNGRCCGV